MSKQQKQAAQLPYNFMKEIKIVRENLAELQEKHTESLWAALTPQVANGMYVDLCGRVPEAKVMYAGGGATLFNKSLTPFENKQLMMHKLGPFMTSERTYKALQAFWASTMAFLMRANEPAAATGAATGAAGELNKLNQKMILLDTQNVLLQQLIQMFEHILTKSSNCDNVEKMIRAIENEHVRDNMFELFEMTKPILKMLYTF